MNSVDVESVSDQADWDWTAGRRMCVGTYLDSAFRDQLLKEVYNARNRRAAPSYSYDLVPVLVHAWRAWRLEMAQHALVLLIFAVVLVKTPIDGAIAASVVAVGFFGHKLIRLGIQFTGYYRGRMSALEIDRLKIRLKTLLYSMLVSCLVLAASVIAVLSLSSDKSRTSRWPARGGISGAIVLLGVIAVIVAIVAAVRQVKIIRLHDAGVPPRRPRGPRLTTIQFQQFHQFTVYSGFNPFVGSGLNVRTWSFAQRLIKADLTGAGNNEYRDAMPFTAESLVGRLKRMISGLRDDENPETRLPGLVVTDHVLVEGTHAGPYRNALRSDPGSKEVEAAIAHVIAHSSDVARHYLACQVASWGGEVVTSVFVHVSLQGRTLYLEYSVYALPPTRKEYHVIDEVGATSPASVARAACKGIFRFPQALLAPRRLAWAPGELLAALRARTDGTLTVRRRNNIGAQVSAREAACGDADESYFQLRDIVQHSQVVERRMISTVGEFLKERGVDTSEFWQRATTILNQGVINAGAGTVNFNADVTFSGQAPAAPPPDHPGQNS